MTFYFLPVTSSCFNRTSLRECMLKVIALNEGDLIVVNDIICLQIFTGLHLYRYINIRGSNKLYTCLRVELQTML